MFCGRATLDDHDTDERARAGIERWHGPSGGDRADARVGDAERERAADLAGRAFAAGTMTADEFEALLEELFRARTAHDLRAALAQVPPGILEADRRARRAERRATAWRASVRTYAAVMSLLVVVWLATTLAGDGPAYPWFVWPALGWGVPLFAGRPRSGPRSLGTGGIAG